MDAWRRPAELLQGAQIPLVLLEEMRALRGTLFAGNPAMAWLVSEMQAVLAAAVRARRHLACSIATLLWGPCACLQSSVPMQASALWQAHAMSPGLQQSRAHVRAFRMSVQLPYADAALHCGRRTSRGAAFYGS